MKIKQYDCVLKWLGSWSEEARRKARATTWNAALADASQAEEAADTTTRSGD